MAVYKAVGTLTTTDFKTIKSGDFVNGTVKMIDSEHSQFEGVLGKGLVGSPVKFSYNSGRGSTFRLEEVFSDGRTVSDGIGWRPKPQPKNPDTLISNDSNKIATDSKFDFKSTKMIAIYVVVAIIIATFVYFKFIKK